MKTVLIATDYSAAAKNASRYGIQLARILKAKVILLHAYQIPILATEVPVIADFDEFEKESLRNILAEKKILDPQMELDIECISSFGFVVDDIIEAEKLYNPDIIIMGMRAVGVLSEYLLGSVTTSLILRTKSPVMIVPEHSEFIRPKNITFACDYNLNPDVDVLMPLKKFVELFNSKIMILNFLKQDHTISSKKAKIGILMENYLKDIAHTYYFEEEKDFIDGIIHFTGKHDTDLIALVPHHHSWIHNLIKGSHTKRLAFHTTIPLLTIPERDQN